MKMFSMVFLLSAGVAVLPAQAVEQQAKECVSLVEYDSLPLAKAKVKLSLLRDKSEEVEHTVIGQEKVNGLAYSSDIAEVKVTRAAMPVTVSYEFKGEQLCGWLIEPGNE